MIGKHTLERITWSRSVADLETNGQHLLPQPATRKAIPIALSAGFTVIELLIVIIVIGILAAIVIVAYNGVTAKARDAKRSSDLDAIVKLLEEYHAQNGGYPVCGGTGTYTPGGTLTAGTVAGCLTDELVPTYTNLLPVDPVNSGSHTYLYAVGFKKTSATGFVGDKSDNYILGDKQDAISSPVYRGWWYSDLTLLLGSSN